MWGRIKIKTGLGGGEPGYTDIGINERIILKPVLKN